MKALYFPNLSLPGAAWTNSVLLFFDAVGVIAPDTYDLEMSDAATAALVNFGLVQPMFGGIFKEHDDEDAFIVESVERALAAPPRPGEEWSTEPYMLHARKLGYAPLVETLVRQGVLTRYAQDTNWLVGPQGVCIQIMTVLAQRILRDGQARAVVTDQGAAMRVATGLATGEGNRGDGRRLRAVSRLLPVAPWATAGQLARFKSDHGPHLRRFRDYVEQLIRRDLSDDMFEVRLRAAEELRDDLESELRSIDVLAQRTSVTLAVANVLAPFAEGSFFSGAVGAANLARTYRNAALRRDGIDSDGLAYAVKAKAALRARSGAEILG